MRSAPIGSVIDRICFLVETHFFEICLSFICLFGYDRFRCCYWEQSGALLLLLASNCWFIFLYPIDKLLSVITETLIFDYFVIIYLNSIFNIIFSEITILN